MSKPVPAATAIRFVGRAATRRYVIRTLYDVNPWQQDGETSMNRLHITYHANDLFLVRLVMFDRRSRRGAERDRARYAVIVPANSSQLPIMYTMLGYVHTSDAASNSPPLLWQNLSGEIASLLDFTESHLRMG